MLMLFSNLFKDIFDISIAALHSVLDLYLPERHQVGIVVVISPAGTSVVRNSSECENIDALPEIVVSSIVDTLPPSASDCEELFLAV